MKLRLTADNDGIRKGLDTIEERLTAYKLGRSDIIKKMMTSEEIMNVLIDNGADELRLNISRFLDDINIELEGSGKEFHIEDSLSVGVDLNDDEIGRDAELIIRRTLLMSVADDLKYRHRSGVNYVKITVQRSKRAMLYRTLGAMLLAVIVGLLLKTLVPETVYSLLDTNLFIPGKTIFMNALKMTVAPVVFFSIASCICRFGDLKEMGKIGRRTLTYYMITTLIATVIGLSVFLLIRPGEFASAVPTGEETAVVEMTEVSIKDTIVNIIPSNFVKPFIEANMLQLIFMAIICGAAVGMTGKYSQLLSDLFSAANELFLKITTFLIKFIPIAAFCSIVSMILQTGAEVLVSVFSILGTVLIGIALMMVVYCLLLICFSRLDPRPFMRRYVPTMLQVFSMATSSAALPVNMNSCERMGISSKVYSLSLPLGSTLNMDGTCIYLGVAALGLARLYGVEIPMSALLSIMVSIIVLSVGAPSVPGSGLICLSVLVTQIGVPVEAVALLMGIDPLIGMLRTMSNALGDVVVSCVVAKQSGLMDTERYYGG